jgi:RNA polymerase sigma-B factor
MESDVVERLMARLPERERRIVQLRFYEQMSQADIAAQVGVSQMQVSRLLRASFERMRGWLGSDPAADE